MPWAGSCGSAARACGGGGSGGTVLGSVSSPVQMLYCWAAKLVFRRHQRWGSRSEHERSHSSGERQQGWQASQGWQAERVRKRFREVPYMRKGQRCRLLAPPGHPPLVAAQAAARHPAPSQWVGLRNMGLMAGRRHMGYSGGPAWPSPVQVTRAPLPFTPPTSTVRGRGIRV